MRFVYGFLYTFTNTNLKLESKTYKSLASSAT